MSVRRHYTRSHPRRITVRGVRHESPDLHKLARVLIALAEAQAEKEAQEQTHGRGESTASEEVVDGQG